MVGLAHGRQHGNHGFQLITWNIDLEHHPLAGIEDRAQKKDQPLDPLALDVAVQRSRGWA